MYGGSGIGLARWCGLTYHVRDWQVSYLHTQMRTKMLSTEKCLLTSRQTEMQTHIKNEVAAWKFLLYNFLTFIVVYIFVCLTLARKRRFATFAGVGGGLVRPPPWCFQTKRRRASRKRPADCSRRVLAIGGIIFGPRSIFDPVMAGQRSNFRKFHDFSTSRVDGIKTIYRSGMKHSPACSPFNSA